MNKQTFKPYLQQGVVLFIALIALVVMSLASVALIRSVDTNTMIAGNLAFKQSALVSSDRGVETALEWIKTQANLDPNILDASNTVDGYYATYLAPNLDSPAVLKAEATWDVATSADATGTGIVAGTEDASKNRIRYIVQRMCREAAPPKNDATNKCLFGSAEVNTSSTGGIDITEVALVNTQQSPMYRVTLRVDGPKNTVSYTQTYVY
ncbi:MAG: hypothetical protein Q8L73_06510 [Methylotenera sp.]|nr:hypothetical protein [Methylotenera sp.]